MPLPPDAAERRRFRGHDYSGKRWRDEDLPALGWRHRRHYDMRATFITLAIEDGADPEILETRVTHTRKSRNAFDGYNRGLHWERTCTEIAKRRIARGPRSSAIEQSIAAGASPDSLQSAATVENRGGGGSRRISDGAPGPLEAGVLDGALPDPMDVSGRDRTIAVARLATALASAVLDGDQERAKTIARTILEQGLAGPDAPG